MNQSKISKMKLTSTIAAILILTMTPIFALPLANAHNPPWRVPTTMYCSVSPMTVGVGQNAIVILWCRYSPPTTSTRGYGDRWPLSLTITKPDGTSQTVGPMNSDEAGSTYYNIVPDQVGNYTFVAIFNEYKVTGKPAPPGSEYTAAGYDYINDTFLASTSAPAYLTVQKEPISGWNESSLPTEYWTRPINSMNRDWYQVGANWLAGAAQTNGPTTNFGYGTAPESAHIMWTTPYWDGGVADARFESSQAMWVGREYESFGLEPPVIINGKIYFNNLVPTRIGVRCIDLYTGEEILENWRNTTTSAADEVSSGGGLGPFIFTTAGRIAFGQMWNYHSPNVHGVYEYLWSTDAVPNQWDAYDPYTNRWVWSIGNVTQRESRPGNPSITTGATGTAVYGNDGSILRYNIVNLGNTTNPRRYLQVWNTTRVVLQYGFDPSIDTDFGMAGRMNKVWDGRNGFSTNVSIPDVQGSIRAVREDQYVIGGTTGTYDTTTGSTIADGNLWALNLDRTKGPVGSVLWNITFVPPPGEANQAGGMGGGSTSFAGVDPEDGIFTFTDTVKTVRYTYSLSTGNLLWTSEPELSWAFYGMTTTFYQGLILSYGYSGQVIAYNATTGAIRWTYNATMVGHEAPYPYYPLGLDFIADGKIYMSSSEHSPTQPFWRGAYLRCINATDGTEIWKSQHWVDGYSKGNMFLADGYIVGLNSYDNQIYCYGKGPSATTATASPEVSVYGSSVLIKGSVNDISAGTKSLVLSSRFPHGVPAVSDDSQELYMAYLYSQQIMPADVKGVEVVISVLDPNNNRYEVGRATSDSSGMFSCAFEPEVPGKYTVIVTFAGSNSYYGSSAETAVNVALPQSTTTPVTTAVAQSTADLYFVPAIAGLFVLSIIVLALVVLQMLRKRP